MWLNLLWLAFFGAIIIFPIAMFIDAVRFPGYVWKATGRDKATWMVFFLIAGLITAVVYRKMVQPELRAVEFGARDHSHDSMGTRLQ